MSKLELKLEGWESEKPPTESIDTGAPETTGSKPVCRFDGHELDYRCVGTTDYSQERYSRS
ncbi:hypothetical protein GB937_004551 [Aspergillus fischeri]|nr:hypothetical protein GB937_004551 [Aspergillus fischeri]